MTEKTEGPKLADAADVADEMGSDAGMLVAQILLANSQGVAHITEQLHVAELRQRMLLEVRVETALRMFDKAHMGSAREYDKAVKYLDYGHSALPEADRLRMHPEYDRWAEALGEEF